jgi:hypothetical protein
VQYSYDDFVNELKGRLQTAHQIAKEKLIGAKEKSKEHYDQNSKLPTFRIGDKVLLYDETVSRGRSRKLCSQWLGPYEITSLDKNKCYHKKGKEK